ncbi:gibberellin 2-beta-dioxygenase-like [Zingiber officinale]|nr:gibberellin 2-beta-dioxygenase-like [Zingiber officinale]
MVASTSPALEPIPLLPPPDAGTHFPGVPVVDLSHPGAGESIVAACQDFGFFKLTGHGIPLHLMQRLESATLEFFHSPQAEKEKANTADPFGYGNKRIGPNGDVGWLEYLLFPVAGDDPFSRAPMATSSFRSALAEYLRRVKELAREVLELMAEGLNCKERKIFSNLVMGEQSEGIIRLNHYPEFPQPEKQLDRSLTGFGEHTDPQVISVLRSNDSAGLQIALKDGSWVSVPPDHQSFFIIVGDSLQVLTNGRLRSVRHRVMANGVKCRVSMIYFLGVAPGEKIAPLGEVMEEGEQSKYREFTWNQYKKAACRTRLGDDRLGQFEK